MKKWFKRLKNEKGMTLVELLAVVVILGIVAAIAVPAVGNIIEKSKDDAHRSNALLIINAAKLGEVTNELPIDADGVSINELKSKKFLDTVPADPDNKGETYDDTNSKVTKSATGDYVITLTAKATTPNVGKKYFDGITESELNLGETPN